MVYSKAESDLKNGFSRLVALLIGWFEPYLVAHLRRARIRRAGRKLQCSSRAEHDRRKPPGLQAPVDIDDSVAPADEHDVDRKAHEEHVHPHERCEPAILEEHPGAGLEAVATEQAATLATDSAGAFESLAEDGRSRLVYSSYCRMRIRRLGISGLSHYLIM